MAGRTPSKSSPARKSAKRPGRGVAKPRPPTPANDDGADAGEAIDEIIDTPLARRIYGRLRELKRTPTRASLDAGLSREFVRNIYRGLSRNPQSTNLGALAVEIGVPLGELVELIAEDLTATTRAPKFINVAVLDALLDRQARGAA